MVDVETVHCLYGTLTDFSDFVPFFSFDERLFNHPGSAHTEDVLAFSVFAYVFSSYATCRHESTLRERTAEVVDDFVTALAFSREEFKVSNAHIDTGSDF